jgi:hypothetical protein
MLARIPGHLEKGAKRIRAPGVTAIEAAFLGGGVIDGVWWILRELHKPFSNLVAAMSA